MRSCDLAIVGAGAAGLPAAIFAIEAGAHVVLIEAADRIGGTFHLSSGQMSAAGSRAQRDAGIEDSPDAHFDDVMRISRGVADPAIVRLAVDHAAGTIDWLLDNGLVPLEGHPVIYPGHEPYRIPRTLWGEEKGKSVLHVLAPLVAAAEKTGRLDIRVSTRLTQILRDGDGAVTGVAVADATGESAIQAGSVLLATGGFTANAELTERTNGGLPLYSGGLATCQGDGLDAALRIGGQITREGIYLPIFAAVSDPRKSGGYVVATWTNPLNRMPWELFVDEAGRRFYCEDQLSPDVREIALKQLLGMRFWAVYDEAIRRASPSFFADPTLEDRFGNSPDFVRAESIAKLAAAAGMKATVLDNTIRSYNDAIASGAPDPMGRAFRPLPLTTPPFYAVRHFGWSITSFAGLKVDGELRVTDAKGDPIPNLYAAGEILGMGQTSGAAFCSGMGVTPALTFGRLLGSRLGKAAVQMAENWS